MKTLTLFILILLSPFINSIAQDTNHTRVYEEYAKVVAIGKFLSNKVSITVDYGEHSTLFTDQRVRDEEGKVAKFNSVIDAMNFMSTNGWVFLTAFPVTHTNQNVYHYYFKREIVKKQ